MAVDRSLEKPVRSFFYESEQEGSGPGVRELPPEATCCICDAEVKQSFCRYPDMENGVMLVMCRRCMVRNIGTGTTTAEFENVLKRRHEKR